MEGESHIEGGTGDVIDILQLVLKYICCFSIKTMRITKATFMLYRSENRQ